MVVDRKPPLVLWGLSYLTDWNKKQPNKIEDSRYQNHKPNDFAPCY
jgi:hypothetical protein